MRFLPLWLLVLVLVGCSYDWSVGPPASPGDAGSDSAQFTDAECSQLVEQAALDWMLVSTCDASCAEKVPFFCGCVVGVEDKQTPAVQTYLHSIAALASSPCVDCDAWICTPQRFVCKAGQCR